MIKPSDFFSVLAEELLATVENPPQPTPSRKLVFIVDGVKKIMGNEEAACSENGTLVPLCLTDYPGITFVPVKATPRMILYKPTPSAADLTIPSSPEKGS